MPHNRTPKKGSKWYLPPYRYKTMVNFCLDYKRMRKELAELSVLSGVNYDGMPHGTTPGDPTARTGERAALLSGKIDMIEQCVRNATSDYPVLYEYILAGVTDDRATYKTLRNRGIPLNEKGFSDRRRRVYFMLSDLL